MSIEVIAVIAFVGLVAYFLGRGKRAPIGTPAETSVPTELTTEAELTSTEREIAKAREALQAGADARKAAYDDHKASLAGAQSTIRDAEMFARECGLDVAVPWLWDHMDCWPSWKEKADQWTPPLALDDLSGTSQSEVHWTWQSHTFGMLFKKWRSVGFAQDHHDYGTITVQAGGVVVAAITAKRDLAKDYDRWHFSGIEALAVGTWVADFIRFYQEVRLADEARSYARDTDHVTAKAARIELG